MITVIIKGLLFSALLVRAAVSDIRRREVDDSVCVSILVVSMIGTGGSFWGATLTALPFFIPALAGPGSIGGGDVKLAFACGAALGVWGGLIQTVIALSLAALFSVAVLLKKGFRACKKTALPLAPFLCAGGVAAYIITNMGGIHI
jgi:leader peptidase (prepilin peptidase)/N-methyltransferase